MSRKKPSHVLPFEYLIAFTALAGALLINYWAGMLADLFGEMGPRPLDLFLSTMPEVPTLATGIVFVYGYGLFLAWLFLASALWERRRAPYIAWSFALLIVVRSFFIILTPLHHPLADLPMVDDPLFQAIGRYLTFKHDLFFSSHTATPFLASLVMRGKYVKRSFLLISFIMAATVLFGRYHYSIDVFGAFFITYAVHKAEVAWFQPFYNRMKAKWLLPPPPAHKRRPAPPPPIRR
jgi:hypothetical protein